MKNYSKPEIMFDCFELSEDIASCAILDTGNSSPYECGVIVPGLGIQIFNANCEFQPGEGEQPCSGVPFPDFNVYRS